MTNTEIVSQILASCETTKEFLSLIREASNAHGFDTCYILADYIIKSKQQQQQQNPGLEMVPSLLKDVESYKFTDDSKFMSGMVTLIISTLLAKKSPLCLGELDQLILNAKLFYHCQRTNKKYSLELFESTKENFHAKVSNTSSCPFAGNWSTTKTTTSATTNNNSPMRRGLKLEPVNETIKIGKDAVRIVSTNFFKKENKEDDNLGGGEFILSSLVLASKSLGGGGLLQKGYYYHDLEWYNPAIILIEGEIDGDSLKEILKAKETGSMIFCVETVKVPLLRGIYPLLDGLVGHLTLLSADLIHIGICNGMISTETSVYLMRTAPFLLASFGVERGWKRIVEMIEGLREYPGPERISLLKEEFINNDYNFRGKTNDYLIAHFSSTFPSIVVPSSSSNYEGTKDNKPNEQ